MNLDSDWANDSRNQNSRGGKVFLGGNGASLGQSQMQHVIAMSTVKAGYIVCLEAF